jgi:hypothetical protein
MALLYQLLLLLLLWAIKLALLVLSRLPLLAMVLLPAPSLLLQLLLVVVLWQLAGLVHPVCRMCYLILMIWRRPL